MKKKCLFAYLKVQKFSTTVAGYPVHGSDNPTLRQSDTFRFRNSSCLGDEERDVGCYDTLQFSRDDERSTCSLDNILVVQCLGAYFQ